MAEDDEYVYPEEIAIIGQADRSKTRASVMVPLLRVNHANLRELLSNFHLPFGHRCALVSFLKRYKRSPWMRWQRDLPQRIGIALAASWEYGDTIAYCGYNGWRCQKPDYCPRCALINRSKPAVREYRRSFSSAPCWYAVSPSFERNPARAGLHFVVHKRDKQAGRKECTMRFNPYRGFELGIRLTPDHHLGSGPSPVLACFSTVFQFAERLVKNNMVDGVFAHREIAWHFRPLWIDPHGHLLINTSVPLSFDDGKRLLGLLARIYRKQPDVRRLYPDLHIERLTSQSELNRWIYYVTKPMDFVKGYQESIQAGVDIGALNLEVDDRIFQGGATILTLRSPRRFGNMRCNGDGYIGAGSVTEWRKEEKLRRKLRQGGTETHRHIPPPKKSRLARIVSDESAARNPELQ